MNQELVDVIREAEEWHPGDTELRLERIAAAVEAYVAVNPIVTELPSESEMHETFMRSILPGMPMLGWAKVRELIASRVTVAPSADQPPSPIKPATKAKTLDEWADPKLRLRRMPTREEWGKVLEDVHCADSGHIGRNAWNVLGDRIAETLTELAEPVELNEQDLAEKMREAARSMFDYEHGADVAARTAIAYFCECANVTECGPVQIDEEALERCFLAIGPQMTPSLRLAARIAAIAYFRECMSAARKPVRSNGQQVTCPYCEKIFSGTLRKDGWRCPGCGASWMASPGEPLPNRPVVIDRSDAGRSTALDAGRPK